MMSLWDALRMNMMISYQELVRTFLRITGTKLAEKWSASGYFFATTRSLDEPITTEWSEKLWLLSRQFSA